MARLQVLPHQNGLLQACGTLGLLSRANAALIEGVLPPNLKMEEQNVSSENDNIRRHILCPQNSDDEIGYLFNEDSFLLSRSRRSSTAGCTETTVIY